MEIYECPRLIGKTSYLLNKIRRNESKVLLVPTSYRAERLRLNNPDLSSRIFSVGEIGKMKGRFNRDKHSLVIDDLDEVLALILPLLTELAMMTKKKGESC